MKSSASHLPYLPSFWFALLGTLLLAHPIRAKVVWAEEFNGDRVDPDTWTHDVGGHGWGNGQLEFNTDRPENAFVENGHLVIAARRESYRGNAFTSARLLTRGRFAFQYGTLEARIKVPDTANGLWPAFWLLGNNFPGVNWPRCGETDILEIGGKEGIEKKLQQRRINCALHYANDQGRHAMKVEWHTAPEDLSKDFHRYKLSWTPERMTFHLDDTEFASFDITGEDMREFHQPQFLILNLAVGSRKNSYTGVDRPEDITASFPARLEVDWIRVTSNPHTKVVLGRERKEARAFGSSPDSLR